MRCLKLSYALVFLLILAILINGCAKAECKISADCGKKTCMAASCFDNKCKYSPVKNCCGNQIKESLENGKPGNKCTCPADYGICEGKISYEISGRNYESKYLEYFCKNDICVLDVPEQKVRASKLIDERDFRMFKLETVINYNEPFDVNKDSFNFRLTIQDDNPDLIFPIAISKILLTEGEILLGEKQTTTVLNGVGDSSSINVPVSYKFELPEEERRIGYKINYEYGERVKDQRLPTGNYTYKKEIVRESYEGSFSTRINFVRSGEADEERN